MLELVAGRDQLPTGLNVPDLTAFAIAGLSGLAQTGH